MSEPCVVLDFLGEYYLSHGDNFPILAPSTLVKILGKLSRFPTSGLAHHYGNRICLDEIKETFLMSRNR